MYEAKPISVSQGTAYPETDQTYLDAVLEKALGGLKKKIVVLDDDPTGVQTVHGVYVYTKWDMETMMEAFSDTSRMFFILTNSRSMSRTETQNQHRIIAQNLAAASKATGKEYVLISRSDSTLRGHYPLETLTLKKEIEAVSEVRFDGEILYPFFAEGGRLTIDSIHYVKEGDRLIPAGQTEFAKDKSFGYTSSYLPDWCEEKSQGQYPAQQVIRITMEELRRCDVDGICQKLLELHDFHKVVVDSISYDDTKVFAAAFCMAVAQGKNFIFRSAAAITKILGGVPDKPLLTKEELVQPGNLNGGMILIGSHVRKTTEQLEELRRSQQSIQFLEFNQHRVLEENGLEQETERIVKLAEEAIRAGRTTAIYTRRDRLDLDTDDKDLQLEISVHISDAITSIVGKLSVQPSFLIAKGGITSSDVGVKALRVRRALVMGQVRPGIPVWKTGPESKFPGMPYIIFPGNVGTINDLRMMVEALMS